MDVTFLYGLLISIGLGGLIGLEREFRKENDTLVGIRTFPLVSMGGYLITFIATHTEGSEAITYVGFAIFGMLAIILILIRQVKGFTGFTTTLAFIITYLIGMMVSYDLILEATVTSVAVTTILISKERLHAYVRVLSEKEIVGALQFITIAFILYPITMNLELEEPWTIFGKGQPLDLNMAILIIIFVSSISFVSFLIVRRYGPALGLRFSGLLGGLVNSEAATASLCTLASKRKDLIQPAVHGIVLANATMFVRNLVVCIFADPSLKVAEIIALPLVAVFLLGLALGWGKDSTEVTAPLEIGSPFAIKPAVMFGAVFFFISGAALLIQDQLGEQAIYFVALGAFASSAAVTASVSSLSLSGSLPPHVAAEVVLLACAISSFNKILITRFMNPDLMKMSRVKLLLHSAVAAFSMVALFIFRTWL